MIKFLEKYLVITSPMELQRKHYISSSEKSQKKLKYILMKAVEKIINGNWYLFIKYNRKMVIKIAKPNDLNFQNWTISLTNGICYTYKEISQVLECLNDLLVRIYGIKIEQITDSFNYPCNLLIIFQAEIFN